MGNADKKEASKKSSSLQFTQEVFEILAVASQDEEACIAEVIQRHGRKIGTKRGVDSLSV